MTQPVLNESFNQNADSHPTAEQRFVRDQFAPLLKDFPSYSFEDRARVLSPYTRNEACMLKLAETLPEYFEHVSPHLRSNAAFMLKAGHVNPDLLRYASHGLDADPAFQGAAAKIGAPAPL